MKIIRLFAAKFKELSACMKMFVVKTDQIKIELIEQ
jgi:hypothetical protein